MNQWITDLSQLLPFLMVAKELIRGLLTVDPNRRLTVDQALEHPWMKVRLLLTNSLSQTK